MIAYLVVTSSCTAPEEAAPSTPTIYCVMLTADTWWNSSAIDTHFEFANLESNQINPANHSDKFVSKGVWFADQKNKRQWCSSGVERFTPSQRLTYLCCNTASCSAEWRGPNWVEIPNSKANPEFNLCAQKRLQTPQNKKGAFRHWDALTRNRNYSVTDTRLC